jgi:hypothetical protein
LHNVNLPGRNLLAEKNCVSFAQGHFSVRFELKAAVRVTRVCNTGLRFAALYGRQPSGSWAGGTAIKAQAVLGMLDTSADNTF